MLSLHYTALCFAVMIIGTVTESYHSSGQHQPQHYRGINYYSGPGIQHLQQQRELQHHSRYSGQQKQQYRNDGRGNANNICDAKTIWMDKTEYRNMPVVKNIKRSTYFQANQIMTQTIISTKSVPYFVTQTQMVPQFMTKMAVLPQFITHTVFSTTLHSTTLTERIYNTITAIRTQHMFVTVCPDGY
ncbi:uncharacterized protein LOC121879370 isoform X1 [Homarus americanus]|uniref:uncharacterized protein LOC121879370 isoform X1 n=1 Tax=Homarus americanus TaxID=6706 RepID=UPI001C48B43B|nr:uncharacterized protein LOC121879370 isoform X1 [Homarus americanus]